MTTSQKILAYISQNGQASGKELTEQFGTISARAIRKQLKNLLDKGLLAKIGRPPKVYYLLSENKIPTDTTIVDKKILRVVNERYLYISPSGEAKYGWEGFTLWCFKTKQDPVKTASEYIATLNKYDEFRKGDFIDGMHKMKSTFDKVFLDKLFYLDFYSIERFGRTKLGQMLLYAKQSQNKALILKVVDEIKPKVSELVQKNKIDGVLFVPPTVKREVQFMRELENGFNLPIKTLSVVKVKTEIAVPQKTLTKLEDSIENARQTIIVDEAGHYDSIQENRERKLTDELNTDMSSSKTKGNPDRKVVGGCHKNVLIIDDAIGSGSTLNETARQLRRKGIVKGEIIGLAITGSFKGFDVISEV